MPQRHDAELLEQSARLFSSAERLGRDRWRIFAEGIDRFCFLMI
jgi:hypothetical protein